MSAERTQFLGAKRGMNKDGKRLKERESCKRKDAEKEKLMARDSIKLLNCAMEIERVFGRNRNGKRCDAVHTMLSRRTILSALAPRDVTFFL